MRGERPRKAKKPKQEGNDLYRPVAIYYLLLLVEPINSYYMVIFPQLTSVTQVPLVASMNSYYMVIFPKLTLVTRVPLVEPINS